MTKSANTFLPSQFQPALPTEIISAPEGESEEFDVLIVGAGPAGLSTAIKLAQWAQQEDLGELKIAVVEKAERIGHHTLSGAIINPMAFRELFPDTPEDELPFAQKAASDRVYMLTESRAIRLLVPPLMKNHGNYVASLCEVVRWLAARAEELGVMVFTGFPATALLVEGDKVVGVRTADRNRGREGQEMPNFEPGMDLKARVTVLAEGTRGKLTQGFLGWQQISSDNPQIYAIGVKELWETKAAPSSVIHTMGWPLKEGRLFGGTFMYPMSETLVSLGLVVGLDSRSASFDPHFLLQKAKTHPLFRKVLEGGQRVEWGAKTIPEGGFYALPSRLSGDGVLVTGDSAGFVNVPTLKGVHYSMYSGIFAARAIASAFKKQDFSSSTLSEYDELVRKSFITRDLRRTRNMRQAFQNGLYQGMLKSGLMYMLRGWWPRKLPTLADIDHGRGDAGKWKYPRPDGKLTFNKADSVGVSGNATRDDVPPHLALAEQVPPEVARFYANLCPAEVYEVTDDGELRVNASNCIDCMTTDILAARWSPREGGSGARYLRM